MRAYAKNHQRVTMTMTRFTHSYQKIIPITVTIEESNPGYQMQEHNPRTSMLLSSHSILGFSSPLFVQSATLGTTVPPLAKPFVF
jgi:hypothetical protein